MLLLGAAVVVFAVACGPGGTDDAAVPPLVPASSPAPAPSFAFPLVERDGKWFAGVVLDPHADSRASVSQVIDGDTIDVLAAQEMLRVRFFGIDAPERDEACYTEARARTTALVGREVLLVPDARLKDPGGRALRYVFTTEGLSIDAALVAEGLARAWRDDGALRDRLVAIEDDARQARRGCLWG